MTEALPGGSAPGQQPQKPADDKSEIDEMLDLDLKSLGKISVREPTMTDPVVQGISKTAEKASESACFSARPLSKPMTAGLRLIVSRAGEPDFRCIFPCNLNVPRPFALHPECHEQ